MNPHQPTAEALAVNANKIIAVGSSSEIKALAGSNTRVINAAGQLVLPGFNDAHTHFMSGGFHLAGVSLRDADSQQEFARRIKLFAEEIPTGQWIKGGDWDHERWPGHQLPTKELIDPVTQNTPVFVSRLDCHMGLANSLALRLASVTSETSDPAGGVIVRDPESGEPTGILKDAAQNLVWNFMPPVSFDEKLSAARAATNYAASLGVTSVQDMSAGSDVRIYQTLLNRGELHTRVYAVAPLPHWQCLSEVGVLTGFGNDMLRIGGLKGFSDGSLGSATAWFYDPYDDAPETCGIASDEMFPEGAMLERIRLADRAGLHVMIHAIGDRANDLILTMYAQVEAENAQRDRRFRIEHAQHLRPEDISRFAKLRVIASMQPYHAIDDGRWAENKIGEERAMTTYALRSLIDSGAVVALGTDWTVAPLNPMLTVYAAATRRTLDNAHPDGWTPKQKITVDEAINAYTVGSAYAEFQETVKGTISPGKLADCVILTRDIFAIDPVEIPSCRVAMTVMDGRVVYENLK